MSGPDRPGPDLRDPELHGPELHGARVDFDGLLAVLGHHLYSTPTVVLRELVQNAHDSCVRRRLEDPAPFTPRITATGALQRGQLTLEDTGAGLTHDETIRYLATVGAGYTRLLRERTGEAELIGAFGLGFLSAYVVSDKVEVITTSYQTPDETWRFLSKGGKGFTLERAPAGPIGTRVTLHLKPDFATLAEPDALFALLRRYCVLLPLPVFAPERVNDLPVPWRQDEDALPPVRRDRLRLEFAARFEPRFEPLCTLPVAAGPARGLLWVQDGLTYGSSDNRRLVLFVRGMLITEDARDLLPRWAGFVGGVIECDALTPTASREDIQRDPAFQAVSDQIAESLIVGLAALPETRPAAWRRILQRHNEALLGAALVDGRLLALLEHALRLPTSLGDLPLPRILERAHGRLYLGLSERGSAQDVLFRALDVPIIDGSRYAAIPFTRAYAEAHGLPLTELGTQRGDAEVFKPALDISPAHQATLERLFAGPDTRVELRRYAPPALPAVLMVDHDVLLKRRLEDDTADARIAAGVLGLARLFTREVEDTGRAALYLNLDAPVIQRLLACEDPARQAHAARLIRAVAFLSTRQSAELDHDVGASLSALEAALLALV